jgi:YVTN family beta-propeller protein
VYSVNSLKTELLSVLQSNFTTISRIGFVFALSSENAKTFLDLKPLFEDTDTGEPYSENLQFIINIINDFQVKNVDYLACNTLGYSKWENYYQLLTQTTGVVVGASSDETGNIKYGGDWVLESTSQDIEFIYFTQSIEYYTYLLDNVTPWLTGIDAFSWYLYVYGNYMYVSSLTGNTIKRIDLTAGTPTLSAFVSGIGSPAGLVSDGTYLYATSYSSNLVRKINMANQTYSSIVTTGLNNPFGIVLQGNYLYVSNANGGNITRVNITDNTSSSFVSGLNMPYGLAISGNYLYATGYSSYVIQKIDLTAQTFTVFANTILKEPVGLIIDANGTYMYAANAGGGTGSFITQTSLSTGQTTSYSSFASGKTMEGIAIYQSNLYTSSIGTAEIFQLALPAVTSSSSIQCFTEGSLIFTDKGYRPVQDLRPGTLVKTLRHGFLPIYIIGKKNIIHPASSKRIKNQLYKCSPDKYPNMIKPLVITGCHSILVDDYENQEQRERTIEVNGNTYVTDTKYRLPACADLRASVYEKPGTYTIYHFALENEDYYMNYGIYANGLLVETSSKRYMKELCGMELMSRQ